MRKAILLICHLILFLTIFISCEKNENNQGQTLSGNYTIQKFIHAITNETQSRGIIISNDNFDDKYDSAHVYLHIVGSQEALYIPLYTVNCGTREECQCFRYNINVLENGDAIVTPIIDDKGTLASKGLSIPNGSSCYFSSVKETIWELDQEQIIPKENHVFYKRDDVTNKEIYRSESNYRIADLTDSVNDIIMYRACTGFTVTCLLYDGEEMSKKVKGTVTLDEEEFQAYMNSPTSQWYMKIYLGGNSLITKYNIGTMDKEGENEYNYGYYSTGSFSSEFNNCQFKQFFQEEATHGRFTFEGFGYYTPYTVRLLTPTLEKDLNVYVLIKKWEGSGEPSEEWLASDEDALYTRIKLAQFTSPENGYFYVLGLLLDVEEFNYVWTEMIKKKQEAANNPASTSRSANGMHYFELENAKVICESY